MAALALVGITGMYLRQTKETGVLGLIGYVLFSAGYLTMLSVETIGMVVLPTVRPRCARLRQRRPCRVSRYKRHCCR